ncbi:deoxyribodipyrimidine photo-lyase [Halobacillus andaensis]|uniref:Deoxyribodipyrimidine photo-lyase n=1 Tax=Halobacillus andaensis TaxID=1176239 RepID=A0A917EY58_HALAA|nr:deoxyribodipyrimidine photo-lyase [Halobacillus andaensis]MBP2004477.1 deoxyribodipyrimidine photo-lyase [Halobacillus andaensis]GGF21330.1 deoxyribodipyrimidine photo-lyase [Halobacillus andaensis]
MGTKVVWFRRDLRLNDHTALSRAVQDAGEDDQLLFIFHIHPKLIEEFTVRHDYFFQTVHSLDEASDQLGAPLHFLYGDVDTAFKQLFNQMEDIDSIYFNYDEVGFGKERDDYMINWFKEQDITVYSAIDHHIHSAKEVYKQDGSYYKVYSPYYKKWQQLDKPEIRSVDHMKIEHHAVDVRDRFKKGQNKWSSIKEQFEYAGKDVGEQAALDRLDWFLDGVIYDYHKERDFPAVDGTSLMSRFLKTGAVSPRTIYHKVQNETDGRKGQQGIDTYIQEIAWRDFYNMIYHFYPNARDKEMVEKYRGIDWNEDDEAMERWKQGETGFPLIDAAMRQLNETGWMHNRLRMAVASFLTKDLLLDWRLGERYFRERLIDYDPASNIGGWQWAASTGTDPVPYFRVFNPTRQSERFDPHGRFIKQWLPELENVEKKYIHEPSKMSADKQEQSNCIIGEDYPEPIVDHKTMRNKAIDRFKNVKD